MITVTYTFKVFVLVSKKILEFPWNLIDEIKNKTKQIC